MRSFDEICAELRAHPEFLAACIWQKSDIVYAMEDLMDVDATFNKNIDEIWEDISLSYWEDTACESGWDAIYAEFREMNAYEIGVE